MGALAAAVLAGLLTGVVDALLTLAGNPDPALWSYTLGYALGPLLVALAWAVPLGLLAGALGGPGASAGVVAAVWLVALLVDAWHAGQGWPALVALGVGGGLGALALARLARDGAYGLQRWSPARRRLVWAGGGAALVAATAATLPLSLATFHGGTGPCSVGDAAPAGPNLLLITVDALRADAAREMRSYQRLAARGIEFTQHVTTSPWTLPSVASLLTGRDPAAHGAGQSLSGRALIAKTPLRGDVSTLAGVLGARGYRTHAIVTNPFLTPRYGIDAGFCSFENITMRGEAARGLAQTAPLRLLRALAPTLLPSDRARSVRESAERWLAAHGDRPFFLWLHFLDPHAPYGDRDGASTSLVLDLVAFEASAGPDVPFRGIGRVRAGEYRPDAAERARIEHLYREDVAFADGEIERLLDVLDARHLAAHTAIVFTADHGEEFWDHGGVEHGRTLYEEVLRVPLVIVPPGGAVVPAVRADLTAVEDVAVSALGLLGVPRKDLPGTDLLVDAPQSGRALALGNLLFGEEWTGMRTPLLKYMRSASGEERLYDLASDPDESVNIVASQPAAVAVLRERLADHPPGSHHDMPARLRDVPSKVPPSLTDCPPQKEGAEWPTYNKSLAPRTPWPGGSLRKAGGVVRGDRSGGLP